MSYELSGTVKKVFELQTFPSGFSKRELVVTTDERYPQDIKIDFLKEKAEMLDELSDGDPVTVHFDIRGREYNGRFFTDLSGWRIDKGAAGAPGKDSNPDPEDPTDYSEDPGDNIPF